MSSAINTCQVCPGGVYDNFTNTCTIKTNAVKKTYKPTCVLRSDGVTCKYPCDTGYTRVGTDTDAICVSNTYSCLNPSAILNGTTCIVSRFCNNQNQDQDRTSEIIREQQILREQILLEREREEICKLDPSKC